MHPIKNLTGAATLAKPSSKVFEDHEWNDRFDTLIRLTKRTTVIKELTGVNLSMSQLKRTIVRRLIELTGELTDRPRGRGFGINSDRIVRSRLDNFDSSYLLSLHLGNSDTIETSLVSPNLGEALDHCLEVYGRYRTVCYPNTEPRITFEMYLAMIKALREHVLKIHRCPTCSSIFAVHAARVGNTICPVCSRLDLKLKDAKASTESQLRQAKNWNSTPSAAQRSE